MLRRAKYVAGAVVVIIAIGIAAFAIPTHAQARRRDTGISASSRVTGISTSSGVTKDVESVRSVGRIKGTLGIYGGSLTSKGGPKLEAGTVRLLGRHGQRIEIRVGKSGHFSKEVPSGRYRVMAGLKYPQGWPMGSCDALFLPGSNGRPHYDGHVKHVTVAKGRTLHVDVGCLAL